MIDSTKQKLSQELQTKTIEALEGYKDAMRVEGKPMPSRSYKLPYPSKRLNT